MNLFELFVKIGVDDQASNKLSNLSSKLGNGLKTAAKIGTAAVGAAAAGITALTTAAVNNYAEYEQLVGGVQTLFTQSASASDAFANSIRNDAKAVKEFQKANGLAVDGILGPKTMAAIEAKYGQMQEISTKAVDMVKESAANAYKTAGMSANEYMSTVTSFSASLIQSLGGDTEAAAEYADRAIISMSDNANKMGTSIDMIQNAYQGFAKQNYTMLDNLKLGYGGTKTEMERLIEDASKMADVQERLGITVDESSMSFDNIVNAIQVVQEKMGIAGATALEAGTTIEGSVNAMKSAWTNLVTGFADGNADIEGLINNLVTTIVGDGTENNLGVIGNVLPAIETALGGIAKLIEGAAPKIIEILPGLVERVVPSVISAATGMVNAVIAVLPDLLNTVVDALIQNAPALITAAIGLVQSLIQGIQDNYQILVDGAIQIVTQLATGILNMLPKIVKLGLDLIVSLANGIANSLPELIPTIMDVILQIVDTLTDPKNLSNLLQAALSIITQLAWGLVDSIPALIDSVMTLIENIVTFLIDPANLAMLIQAAIELVVALGMGLIQAIPKLMLAVPKLIAGIVGYFLNYDWGSLGTNLVDGFKRGIQNAWRSLTRWFKNLFGDLIGIAKKILGIASPSKVFKKLGSWTADGFGIGFEDEFGRVKKDIEDSLSFGDASVGISASVKKVGTGKNVYGENIGGVSIVQNIYSEAKTAADLMQEALYQQERAVMFGV